MSQRALGANSTLALGFETTYGTAADEAWAIKFASFEGGEEIDLEESDLLGAGREPEDPDDGPIKNEPSIKVPVDARQFGLWLKLMLGDPATTGAGPYVHTWTSGSTALPSATLDYGQPELSKHFLQTGVRGGSMALDWAATGKPSATMSCVAQGETEDTDPIAAAAPVLAVKRFAVRQGYVKMGGSFVGNLVGGKLTYANGLDPVRTIRSDGKIDDADPGKVVLSGELRIRFSADAILTASSARTPIALEFGYDAGAGFKLAFTLPRLFLPKAKKSVQGPQGIERTYSIKASGAGGAA